jgi:hypothetical protein
MKINRNTSHSLPLEAVSAETQAAALAHRDAQKSKRESRKTRREAQKAQIKHMKESADKLREMADQTLYNGILKCGSYLAGLAAEGTKATPTAAGEKGTEGTLHKGCKYSAIALKALENLNYFGYKKETLAADKAEIDAYAEAAGHNAKNAGDDVGDARRLEGSMINLMQKMHDSRQAALRASTKV